jgi:hypothetical protein
MLNTLRVFFAANVDSLRDPGFFRLARVAFVSALERAQVKSCLMLDGQDDEIERQIRAFGVTIFPVKCSIEHQLTAWMQKEGFPDVNIRGRRGSYLRMELPKVIEENRIDDELVLYTDLDVFFRSKIPVERLKTRRIAAAGTRMIRGIGGLFSGYHFQAGVMAINTRFAMERYDAFRAFVIGNGLGCRRPRIEFFQKNLFLSDQVAINLFFKNQINRISSDFNHNPASGRRDSAIITHFNGLKWTEFELFVRGELSEKRMAKFSKQVGHQVSNYRRESEEVLDFEYKCFGGGNNLI